MPLGAGSCAARTAAKQTVQSAAQLATEASVLVLPSSRIMGTTPHRQTLLMLAVASTRPSDVAAQSSPQKSLSGIHRQCVIA